MNSLFTQHLHCGGKMNRKYYKDIIDTVPSLKDILPSDFKYIDIVISGASFKIEICFSIQYRNIYNIYTLNYCDKTGCRYIQDDNEKEKILYKLKDAKIRNFSIKYRYHNYNVCEK